MAPDCGVSFAIVSLSMRSPAEKTTDPYSDVEQRSNGKDVLGRPRPTPHSIHDAGGETELFQWTTFRTILRVLRRRRLIVALCTLAAGGLALALALAEEKQYESSSSLLFRPSNLESSVFDSASSRAPDADRAAATNADLAGLDVIADRAAARLDQRGVDGDFVASHVDVFSKQESDLATITARTEDPDLSRRVADAFAGEYMAFRRRVDRAGVRDAQRSIERRLADLSPRERRTREGRRLSRVAQQLEVLAALRTGSTALVQRAKASSSAVSPRPKKNLALGLMLGLMLGVTLGFVREFLDRRLHDEMDVGRAFGLPVLASIPRTRTIWRADSSGGHSSPEGEAFRMLRANLRHVGVDREIRSLLVTSAGRGEGKSAVAFNLALAEVNGGLNVLLIEADLRAGRLAQRLKLTTGGGLTSLLAGGASMEQSTASIRASSGRLDVIPAGPTPTNPADLGESPQMALLLESAQMRYDLVIVDTPPVSAVADAVPLMNQVGGVIVVASLGQTTADRARELRDQLMRLDVPTLGVVVNAARQHR